MTISAVTILPSGAAAPAAGGPASISMDATGRIQGVDGMLTQIAQALAGAAVPLVRTEVLPVLQQDRELQRTVGAAMGREIGLAVARKMWPYAAVITAAMVVIAISEWRRAGSAHPPSKAS